jgi:DnaJ-class molecular chaperone
MHLPSFSFFPFSHFLFLMAKKLAGGSFATTNTTRQKKHQQPQRTKNDDAMIEEDEMMDNVSKVIEGRSKNEMATPGLQGLRRRTCLFFLQLLCVMLCLPPSQADSLSSSFNPYKVLGVPRDATQTEIKRQYKKLCLRYHPDKNVQKTTLERKKCEEMFKQVQKAHHLIGDSESRRNFDYTTQYHPPFSSPQYSPSSRGASYNRDYRSAEQDLYQTFYQQAFRSQPTFRFGGVDVSHFFDSGGSFSPPSPFWNSVTKLRSKYVQHVTIPLEHLYSGKSNVELMLRDPVWRRYPAAFRGGVGTSLLYQSLAMAISMIRVVRFPWSFLLGAIFFHVSLPRPTKMDYVVNLKRGWKGGTKLTFSDVEPGFDVVFVLHEDKHGQYRRVGNDLYTRINISESQRRKGCTVSLEPLGASEQSIMIQLEPNQIDRSGGQVRLQGQGWPTRKGSGDLVVTVKVIGRSRRREPSQ